MSETAPRRRGFTLVELLVVIGIIGALIAILLPVLSGVQSRGRDIKCQSNLRQIVQALIGYATENKGSMPYGFYYARSDPQTWDDVGTGEFISWASQVGKYMVKRASGDNDDANFPPVLQCPEATLVYPHPLSYIMNMIVGVAPYYELVVGAPPNAQFSPPKVTAMLKEGTALVWDTAIQSDWENNVGYLVSADIDGQRFWDGAASPQLRYYNEGDPFGQIPPGTYGNSKPVRITTGSYTWRNIDPPGSAPNHFSYQGNMRFRHNKETAVNVGFSDGHVGQFVGKIRRDKTMQQHDALRKFFMIKFPTGVIPDPGLPQ